MPRRLLHVTVFEGRDLLEFKQPYLVAELITVRRRRIRHERTKTKAMVGGSTVIFKDDTRRGSQQRQRVGSSSSDRYRASSLEGAREDDEENITKPSSDQLSEFPDHEGVTLTLGKRHDLSSIATMPLLRLTLLGHELLLKDHQMGEIVVDLALLPMDGTAVTEWKTLEPTSDIQPGISCGSLRVCIRLDAAESRQMVSAAYQAGRDVDRYTEGMEEGLGDQLPEFADDKFNFLKVRVRRARGLKDMDDGNNVSDPYVKLICENVEHRTKVVRNTLEPEWDEVFNFAVTEPSHHLYVEVYDADPMHDSFQGKFNIQLEQLMHRKRLTRWYDLLNEDEVYDRDNILGEIELTVQWYSDPSAGELAKWQQGWFEALRRKIIMGPESSDEEEVQDEDEEGLLSPEQIRVREEARKKLEQEDETAKKAIADQLQDFEVKSGDYTIYVHIIEVRNLEPKDVQGTSDPVVYMEAFGQKFCTEVKQACLSAVFDEAFVINLRNLDKDVFTAGVIRVCVMDADGPAMMKNDLIGSYTFDAESVYFQKDHEIHRQWVALIDDVNPLDQNAQGYLQLSVAIVGPGDKLKVHDEEEERRKEKQAEDETGGVNGMVVMIPPNIKTRTQWLVTTVVKAEYLPVMDERQLQRKGGDFLTMVSVSGGAPATSTNKRVDGKRNKMNPVWHDELWVPTTVPSMSGTVRTTVMDGDVIGGNQIVACVNMKLRELERTPGRQQGYRWYPLYGPPIGISVGKLSEQRHSVDDDTPASNATLYTTLPQKASTYRGRILLRRRIVDELPRDKDKSTAWKRRVRPLPRKKEPDTARYAMRCYVSSGSDLPKNSSLLNLDNQPVGVRVSIGSHVLETPMKDNVRQIEWRALLESKSPIVLPVDTSQMPDVFVHLLRGHLDPTPICFCRIPAKDVIDQGFEDVKPKWFLLKEDKVLNLIEQGQYPGSVLIKLSLGSVEEFAATTAAWQAEALKLRSLSSYLLRVHIYQGRDFPAADRNGLMDPYLKLQCQTRRMNTETFRHNGEFVHRRRATVDPAWYFTWEADLLLPDPEMQAYFSNVTVRLMDHDIFDADDYAGSLFLDLADVPITMDQDNIPPPRDPSWKAFFLEEPGDSSGELLVSCQLIKTTRAGLVLEPPPDLTPKLRPAYLEVLAVGVRGLQPFGMLPIQLPHVELKLNLPSENEVSLMTNPSKKPSGANANFLERLVVPVNLPVNEIFAPRLTLRVVDNRLGGFLTPVVAVGSVDLATKLPWSRTYKPPSSSTKEVIHIMDAAGAPVFKNMFDDGQQLNEEKAEGSAAGSKSSSRRPSLVVSSSDSRIQSSLSASPSSAAAASSFPTLREEVPGAATAATAGASFNAGGVEEEKSSVNIAADDRADGGITAASTSLSTVSAVGSGGGVRPSRPAYGTFETGDQKEEGAGGALDVVFDRQEVGGVAAAGGDYMARTKKDRAAPKSGYISLEKRSATKRIIDLDLEKPLSREVTGPPSLETATGKGREWPQEGGGSSGAGGSAVWDGDGGSGVGELILSSAIEDVEADRNICPEIKVLDAMGQEDDGTGVFGAMLHEPALRESVIAAVRVKKGPKVDDDDYEGPPKYMIGRDKVEAELEQDLCTTPFENYALYRGQKFGLERGSTDYRAVGTFKCVVRVTVGNPDDEPLFAPDDKELNQKMLKDLLKPKVCVVRLYLLEAINLNPMDMGFGGRPGKSDPYVKVTLGKDVYDDEQNYLTDVTDADLFKCIEFSCELPGAGELQIDVMDFDRIGAHGLIGRTVVDLEDRWFDQRWQKIGMENRLMDASSLEKIRWQTKPLENRSLYVPTSNAPQGLIKCWVDIMPQEDAQVFQADDVALPPAGEFELRLVIWKCKDVVSADWLSGLNDLFVKAWIQGCDPQETDTHWRAKGGKGSFNWRMKFKVELGPRAVATKFPYLTLQMWDRDVLKWNDCIAEGILDLSKPFYKAFKKKTEVLKLFESEITDAGKNAVKSTMVKAQQALAIDQARALNAELQTGIANPLLGDAGLPSNSDQDEVTYDFLTGDDWDDVAELGFAGGRPSGRPAASEPLRSTKGSALGSLLSRWFGCSCCGLEGKKKAVMSPLELRQENDRRKTLGMPLLTGDEGLTAKEAAKKRREEGDEEVKDLIDKVKAITGLSSDDPPDTEWVGLEKIDKNTGKKEPMGRCLIGIQLYPLEAAQLQPVGTGRLAPNNTPFLPPPSGRLSFTWNPISMLYQLLGPRLFGILTCLLCVIITVALLILFQPLWNLMITLFVS